MDRKLHVEDLWRRPGREVIHTPAPACLTWLSAASAAHDPAEESVVLALRGLVTAAPLTGRNRALDGVHVVAAAGPGGLAALAALDGTAHVDRRPRRRQRPRGDPRLRQADPVRRPEALKAWLTAYAAATATDPAYTTMLDAATKSLVKGV